MPPPVDICARLRQRLAQLKIQLRNERNLLNNATLAAEKLKHQENIHRILSQIDHERALMEEMGCEHDLPFPPPSPTISILIAGVEVTQAIQHYRASEHLTDPADLGADNSVRLVANKPAWVRVYVHSTFSDLPGVTATLAVQRRAFGFSYSTVATLAPQAPGIITAKFNPHYVTERSALNATLNFVIPATDMLGNMRLRVSVNQASLALTAGADVYLDVTLRQTLRLAGIMIGYNGSNGAPVNPVNITLPAPTLADLQATAPFSLTAMPVQSTATYRIAGNIIWTTPLTDAALCAGCCSQNWLNLNAAVQQVRVNDGNQTNVIYYGLMAAGIPTGPVGGCNSGGVSTGPNGNQVIMAHEIGHYVGLAHAPCGVPGDPNYPAYEPYDPANTPNASIGEYGLNINNGNILSPQTFRDYMSYCGPSWISLYHHGRLINNNLLDPVIVGVDLPWWRDYIIMDPNLIPERWLPDPPPDPLEWRRYRVSLEPLISIIGIVHSDKEVEVQSVARVDAYRELPNAEPTEFLAELVDEEGKPLAAGPLYRLPGHGHGGCCGNARRVEEAGESRPPYLFQAFLPNVAPGAALRIRHGDDEVWIRRAPADPPSVGHLRAAFRERTLQVEWEASSAMEAEPEVWAQWSADEGKTWHSLTVGLQGQRAEVDLATLPAGKVSLRLLAHDGFFTAASEPVSLEIPQRPPTAAILHPRDGSRMEAGSVLRLWGTGTNGSGRSAEPGFARWLIDGYEVARGLDVFVTAPGEGKHRCTLIIEAGRDLAEATITFETVAVPRQNGAEGAV
jgi:hypothetical protein